MYTWTLHEIVISGYLDTKHIETIRYIIRMKYRVCCCLFIDSIFGIMRIIVYITDGNVHSSL